MTTSTPNDPTMPEQCSRALDLFNDTFGAAGDAPIIAFAPGRGKC